MANKKILLIVIAVVVVATVCFGVIKFTMNKQNKTPQQQMIVVDEKTEIQNYHITLDKEVLSLIGQGTEKVLNASHFGIASDFASAKTEIDYAKSYYEQAQTKLNTLTPPEKMKTAQELVKQTISKYTLCATILSTAIAQRNMNKLTDGINTMNEGTELFNQAGDEIIRVKKELNIQ